MKFLNKDKNFELFLDKIEYPFLRFKIKNNEILLNYRNALNNYNNLNSDNEVYFIEYIQSKSQYKLQFYKGKIQVITNNRMVCEINENLPRLGALALTKNNEIVGVVTALENNNVVVIETMNHIENNLNEK